LLASFEDVPQHPATAFPSVRTALLLVDVINPFNFAGGAQAAKRWHPAAKRIAALRERARRASVLVVYVNDNFGQWRSDFKAIVQICGASRMPGRDIVRLLMPEDGDFFVLKPTLSGFHETPLHLLLRSGNVETVALAGFAADICIFFTAADAHMREYRVIVPRDCVAAEKDRDRLWVLRTMERLFDAKTTVSTRLRLVR
jgi:nicotinamidase-related amidase